MSRTAKLIFVSDDNHNKYYHMVSDGSTISVEFGRVGATCQKTSYPDSKWDSLIKSKVKKGYTDVTHLFVEPTAQTILTRCALVTSATVVSSEVVEKEEEKYVAPNKQEAEAYNALPYLEQIKVVRPQPTYILVKVKYSHYHLVGADGRKYVLISKSKKKGLTTGVTALVEYAVEDLSDFNNGSRPVSFVTVI